MHCIPINYKRTNSMIFARQNETFLTTAPDSSLTQERKKKRKSHLP